MLVRNTWSHAYEWGVFMGVGLFIVSLVILFLLEKYGIISDDIKWGFPFVVVFIWISFIYYSMKGKKKD